ncbi:fasciclin domain-containing protein [Arthrobacter sp. PAMC 25486]|uniref:fasciclin domain-containing protein n=1 Tax=Arthrobacter sp. PAMC 25486 TaxID=1494608 RepID=UPI0009DF5F53|nr:fasciclin domain-containing protein [Arthrobacter sp. PAMC 25486]
MKFGNRKSLSLGLGLLAITALGITSCSGGTTTSPTTEAPMTSEAPMSSAAPSSMAPMADEGLVGSGCAAYAAAVPSGAGSVAGMAADPVATAASNNPLLKTLTAAVSGQLNKDVNLVDTLNSGEFTVFAPVDDAFAKIPAETIDGLKTDSDTLTSILTYHVVPGQLAPSKVDGTHATAEGSDLTVTGSGDNLEVNGAKVICGGVKTANATVYLIDTVLMPPAKK